MIDYGYHAVLETVMAIMASMAYLGLLSRIFPDYACHDSHDSSQLFVMDAQVNGLENPFQEVVCVLHFCFDSLHDFPIGLR